VEGKQPGQEGSKQPGEKRSRKRKRKAYQPNAREREAEARHDRVEASLLAAHSSFRQWMERQGATTLEAALRTQCSSQPSAAYPDAPWTPQDTDIPMNSGGNLQLSDAPGLAYGRHMRSAQSAGTMESFESRLGGEKGGGDCGRGGDGHHGDGDALQGLKPR
jgi:hypothetical protein